MYEQKLKDLLILLIHTIKIDLLSQHIKNHYNIQYNEIKLLTNFLDNDCKYTERIYCIIHDITNKPLCNTCHIKHTRFYTINNGYSKYCCNKCVTASSERVIKTKATTLSKYGVTHILHLKSAQDKLKKTCQEKYGTNYPLQSKEIQNKAKITLINKYGVDSPIKADSIREKITNTNLYRYGVENLYQLPESYEHSKWQWKDYILPSGKIIRYQGYENKFLDEFFKTHDESQIITDKCKMPKITYIGLDRKKHYYFPDFYIPKENKIIEIKCEWTMNSKIITNYLKEEACKKAGLFFEFIIY